MRTLFVAAAAIASIAALCLTPEPLEAHGRGFYRGHAYYHSAPVVYYRAPTMHYASRVYYAPPVHYRQPHACSYQPSYAPDYSSMSRATATVAAYDKVGFKPQTINVAPGTTVHWVNYGKELHTVTSRDGLFDSELPPGASYSFTFHQPGTYHYFCRPHEKMGMVGTVVVGYGAQSSGGYGGAQFSDY